MNPEPGTDAPETLRSRIAGELERTRRRTVALTDCVEEGELTMAHSPLMSPLVWDYAHIGNQEERWLVRGVGGREPLRSDIDHLYDAFDQPRAERPALPLLSPAESAGYVGHVRETVLDVLDRSPLSGMRGGPAWVTENFMFGLLLQHEQQHDETMLATHQLRAGQPVLHADGPPAPRSPARPGEVFIAPGAFTMGTSTDAWALDNERPATRVRLDGYFIDRYPVTNAEYACFVADGGYDEPRWWSQEGWAHRLAAELSAPQFWESEGSWFSRDRFGLRVPLRGDEPVVHVCFHEAAAYAAWAGKRLPTEAEWEKAARFDPATGETLRNPWGEAQAGPEHANLGQRYLEPARIGAYPAGASPSGVHQMIGDVWEWTTSGFGPYPGFAVMPYEGYSAPFFGGDYQILRGGSFGTDPLAARATFRNWDHPVRRQIFSGFRCACDPRADEAH
jgi:iron(II)-dependent oxidoreductase